jgi:hypothetical protein
MKISGDFGRELGADGQEQVWKNESGPVVEI